MAFPTTGILDALNVGPTENPLSHGGNWVGMNSGLNLRLNTDGTSFFAQGQNSATPSSRIWNPATYGPDTEVYITCVKLPASTNYIRLWARISNPGAAGQTSYMLQWGNGTNNCSIHIESSLGSFSQLAQTTQAYVVNDVLGFSVVGSTLTAYLNGTSVLSTTDSTYTSAGSIALGIKDSTGWMQQFGGGTVVVAAAGSRNRLMRMGVG